MNNISQIDSQIEDLLKQKESIKDDIFKKASSNWLSLVNTPYESSSSRTPEYLLCHKVFKKQFTKLLRDNFEIVKVEIFKPNHFDLGGFFELSNGKIFYFKIDDLTWSKDFLIREAESFTDYTGKTNQYCDLDDID